MDCIFDIFLGISGARLITKDFDRFWFDSSIIKLVADLVLRVRGILCLIYFSIFTTSKVELFNILLK